MLTTISDNRSAVQRLGRLLSLARRREVFFTIVVCIFNASCRFIIPPPPYHIYAVAGATMGTTYEVKIVIPREDIFPEGLATEIQTLLDKIDSLMSTYKEDSELSRFNKHTDPTPFPLSEEMREVITIALNIAEETKGTFDITIFPLVHLWGFGPTIATQPPAQEEIDRARQKVGYQKLEWVDDGLRKKSPDVECDLSAIAKGYAVDKVAELLNAKGINRYMIEVGGEVRVHGDKYPGKPWSIGIEQPISAMRTVFRVVKLTNSALATSGNYRNYYVWDGKRYSHEIDPRTGYPVPNSLASVTVLHDSCTHADAYATALMVMGLEEGYAFAEQHQLPALFIYPTSEHTFSFKTTSHWEKRIREQVKK